MSLYRRAKKRIRQSIETGNSRVYWIRPLRRSLLFIDGLKQVIESRFWLLSPNVQIQDYRPDFIGIGAQKAATTWLDAALRKHKSLRLPVGRKEVHFFNRNVWKGRKWYFWHFRGGVGRVKGEITPAHYCLINS